MAGQVRKEELLAKADTFDGRKEWCCRFCSETNVWTRSKCRPSVLQGVQAVSTQVGRSWSESSSSSDCDDKVLAHKTGWATQREVRELRQKVKWYEGEKKQWTQGELAEICRKVWEICSKATEIRSIHLEKEMEIEADRFARREAWTNAEM